MHAASLVTPRATKFEIRRPPLGLVKPRRRADVSSGPAWSRMGTASGNGPSAAFRECQHWSERPFRWSFVRAVHRIERIERLARTRRTPELRSDEWGRNRVRVFRDPKGVTECFREGEDVPSLRSGHALLERQ